MASNGQHKRQQEPEQAVEEEPSFKGWFEPYGPGPNPPWVLHYCLIRHKISTTEYHFLVMVNALSKYNEETGKYDGCFATNAAIAKELRISVRRVLWITAKLIKFGVLKVKKTGRRRRLFLSQKLLREWKNR